ncbi:ROK family protein [Streptomyces sp. NPDC058254]|uniref:ROK family protein n=1 Tax=Streptomyces sp. NPDC058254 TaxID=3346406 RepID=UPI0036E9213F
MNQLLAAGLLDESGLAPSTGGRAARTLRFRPDAGHLLVARIGMYEVGAAITDLDGRLLVGKRSAVSSPADPEAVLNEMGDLFDALLAEHPRVSGSPTPVWGIGVGLPGAVDPLHGRTQAPAGLPHWDFYPIADVLAARYGVPVRVDNDVNLMALGELRTGVGRGEHDLLHVEVGTSIAAGLVSGGRLHRGAQGAAGDIGHMPVIGIASTTVCSCGGTGCLDTVASGAALVRQATAAVGKGTRTHLTERIRAAGSLTVADIVEAARNGDAYATELLVSAGMLTGRALAAVMAFYNPALLLVGGPVAADDDAPYLIGIREAVHQWARPLALRDLRIEAASSGDQAGLQGAAFLLIDELFSRDRLIGWITSGSPVAANSLVLQAD